MTFSLRFIFNELKNTRQNTKKQLFYCFFEDFFEYVPLIELNIKKESKIAMFFRFSKNEGAARRRCGAELLGSRSRVDPGVANG